MIVGYIMSFWRLLLLISLLNIIPVMGFAAWLKCDRLLEEDEVRMPSFDTSFCIDCIVG